MKVYTFVDSRSIDRYEEFKLFLKKEDAEKMRDSMKEEAKFYDVHKVEIIE
jgi:hypothetical protein